MELIFLGTSNAVPDETHDNTHMVVVMQKRIVLIDCPSSPLIRLEKAGLDVKQISDLILTHFHPDHIAGAPSFIMQSWLTGRKTALHVHALEAVLERFEKMMALYEWDTWPNFYPVHLHPIPKQEKTTILQESHILLSASPVQHMIPNIGLRIESTDTGRTIAYSCDTEPCDAMVRLAQNVDVLIHESTGNYPGHSSAEQAGEIAQKAQAKALYLIHYNPRLENLEQLVEQAKEKYSGPVQLAKDFMNIVF